MTEALKDRPATPFRVPPGLRLVRVNPANGQLAQPGDRKAIWEAFLPGTEPNPDRPQIVLDGSANASPTVVGDPSAPLDPSAGAAPPAAAAQGTGGLY
jgi:penicillin-binding protein 1A